jgi:hypothetical protein
VQAKGLNFPLVGAVFVVEVSLEPDLHREVIGLICMQSIYAKYLTANNSLAI